MLEWLNGNNDTHRLLLTTIIDKDWMVAGCPA